MLLTLASVSRRSNSALLCAIIAMVLLVSSMLLSVSVGNLWRSSWDVGNSTGDSTSLGNVSVLLVSHRKNVVKQ